MSRVLRLCLALALTALTAAAAAQEASSAGEGPASMSRGARRPLAGSVILRGPNYPSVRVTVDSPTRMVHGVHFTDGSGTFYIGSLPVGTYSVLLEAPGYVPQRETIEIPPGTGPYAVQFMLVAETAAANVGSTQGFVSVATLKIAPEAAREYTAGVREAEKRRWPQARKHFDAALQKEARFAPAHHALARLDLEEGKVQEALQHLQQAVEIDPRFDEGHLLLSVVLNQMGQHADALEAANRAVSLRPNAWQAQYQRGFAALGLGQGDTVLDACARIVTLAGAEIPESLLLRGGALLHQGQAAEAEKVLWQFLRLAPKHPHAPMVQKIVSDLQQQARVQAPQ